MWLALSAVAAGWAAPRADAQASAGTRPTTTATAPAATRPGRGAAAVPPEVVSSLKAHGTDSRFWVARTPPGPGGRAGESTDIYVRAHSDPSWQRAMPLPLPVRVVDLAHRGPQLVVLLESGQWLFLTDAGTSSGPPLPHAARLLALAGGEETLWALGLLPAAKGPATAPAAPAAPATTRATTTPATGRAQLTTAPATAPSAATGTAAPDLTDVPPGPEPKLVLYALQPRGWGAAAELPDWVPPSDDPARFSLAVSDEVREVQLAHLGADGGVRVLGRPTAGGAGAAWRELARIDPAAIPFRPGPFKLLAGTPVPVLWLAEPGGREMLYFLRPDGPEAVALDPAPGATARAATYGNKAIRLLRVVDGKLYEQRLEHQTGAKQGEAAEVPLPSGLTGVVVTQWLNVVLTLLLVFAVVATLLRRREIQQAVPDAGRLNLAPLGPRVLAGLVDALPLLVTAVVVSLRESGQAAEGWMTNLTSVLVLIGAGAVYILHTTVGELIAGRSIGKRLFGLRVVRLDGRPASAGAVIVRNVLRIIDVGMVFLPLVLVAFSPLRQRPGDVAAGTLVVNDKRSGEGDSADAPPPDAGNGAPPRE